MRNFENEDNFDQGSKASVGSRPGSRRSKHEESFDSSRPGSRLSRNKQYAATRLMSEELGDYQECGQSPVRGTAGQDGRSERGKDSPDIQIYMGEELGEKDSEDIFSLPWVHASPPPSRLIRYRVE